MTNIPKKSGVAVTAVAWVVTYLVARGLLESTSLSQPVRLLIALAPVPLFGWFLVAYVRMIRGADELQRRIHLEALAFAFPAVMLVIMLLGLLEIVVPLSRDDFSLRHIWAFFPILYLAGVAIAARRYGVQTE